MVASLNLFLFGPNYLSPTGRNGLAGSRGRWALYSRQAWNRLRGCQSVAPAIYLSVYLSRYGERSDLFWLKVPGVREKIPLPMADKSACDWAFGCKSRFMRMERAASLIGWGAIPRRDGQ